MAYEDLRSFLKALEKEGELRRVTAEVDPYLEVGEITDRVQKSREGGRPGPALLFENVKGSKLPLAMNVFGSERRLCLALGVESLDEIGERIAELLKPELPHGISRPARTRSARRRSCAPCRRRRCARAPCQEVVLSGEASIWTCCRRCRPGRRTAVRSSTSA